MQTAYANSAVNGKEPSAREQFEHMTTFLASGEARALPHEQLEEWLTTDRESGG